MNDINKFFKEKKKEAKIRYHKFGTCLRCGEPLDMTYDELICFCKKCGWVKGR